MQKSITKAYKLIIISKEWNQSSQYYYSEQTDISSHRNLQLNMT